MKKFNQSGSSLIIALVSFIVLVGIAGIGWSVLHKTAAKPSNASTVSPTTQSTASNHLKIKEWSLTGAYSPDVTLSYKMLGDNTLSLKDTGAASEACKSVGGLSRYSASDRIISPTGEDLGSASQEYAKDSDNTRHIGGYYYLYSYPQLACADSSTASGKLLVDRQGIAVKAVQSFLKNAK